jgi:hypothetical protein
MIRFCLIHFLKFSAIFHPDVSIRPNGLSAKWPDDFRPIKAGPRLLGLFKYVRNLSILDNIRAI